MGKPIERSIIVSGPTASGKTSIAEKLAIRYNSPLINCDLSQTIKRFDIGTGKVFNPPLIDYRLIDIFAPNQLLSSYNMVMSLRKTVEILKNQKVSQIICGGSHHVMERYINGMKGTPLPDLERREELRNEESRYGPGYLHGKLSDLDEDLAKKVHPNNINRILRYIEISSDRDKVEEINPLENVPYIIFIQVESGLLRSLVDRRIDLMLEKGWVEEVIDLKNRGFSEFIYKSGPIGYVHILDNVNGNIEIEEARSRISRDTMELARSQLKWRSRIGPHVTVLIQRDYVR
jgi:tRNA dimethylallyltransferase